MQRNHFRRTAVASAVAVHRSRIPLDASNLFHEANPLRRVGVSDAQKPMRVRPTASTLRAMQPNAGRQRRPSPIKGGLGPAEVFPQNRPTDADSPSNTFLFGPSASVTKGLVAPNWKSTRQTPACPDSSLPRSAHRSTHPSTRHRQPSIETAQTRRLCLLMSPEGVPIVSRLGIT